MKLSLDVIGYGGYFTKDNEKLSLEDAIRRAAKFGYDAACIFAHRPLGFPMDFSKDRRKKLVDLYQELDLEVGGIVCCNNFVDANHVLVFNTEKEVMYTEQCIDLAEALGGNLVRVMASLWGYFQNPWAGQGYGLPSFEARSRRVSRGEDFLDAWHQVRIALTEVAKYAQDKGITLALQTHPEITGNNDETLEMLAEVGVESLQVGVDLPLMEAYDPGSVRKTVLKMGKHMVYSHTISLASNLTIGGAPYGWEEVTPGTERDPLPWKTFIEACKEIDYQGLFSHEQCSPILVKGHQLGGLAIIDERYVDSRNYFHKIFKQLDCYSGHKPEIVEYSAIEYA
ncbi:MAG: sugar phosphate isomerase/epimerase [Anaerolineaceae bacterium]|nr:sugar phosphate isomerase/epimerase [Anaerolineaceae bacterium]